MSGSVDIVTELLKVATTALVSGGVAILASHLTNRNNNKRILIEFQERDKRIQADIKISRIEKLFEAANALKYLLRDQFIAYQQYFGGEHTGEALISALRRREDDRAKLRTDIELRIKLYFPEIDFHRVKFEEKLSDIVNYVAQSNHRPKTADNGLIDRLDVMTKDFYSIFDSFLSSIVSLNLK